MKRIKHYKIVGRLGSGGMGEVYKAFDSVLERNVAIKVMHRHLLQDEANDARFMREARIAAKLVHPNIVTIHEVGKAKFGRYIVMEFVQGSPLTKLLQAEGVFELKGAIQLTIQILSGLHYAHSMGILHRDIKPDNLLITENEIAKILDFGIAKIKAQEGLTVAGDILGTVEYMAPEQLLGETIDHRCDIYAVGVVLYQILTHQLPYASDSPAAILYKKLNEEPVPPSFYKGHISHELNQSVLKAIHNNKEERWQTAEAFSDALNDILSIDTSSAASIKSDDAANFTNVIEKGGDPSNLHSVFIGREKEFKKLIKLFSQSSRGRGQTVIFVGEAGVGKSTLAAQLRNYAEQNKALVLYGSCLYQEGMDAYLPYIDALREFFSKQSHNLPEEERMKLKNLVREKVPLLMEFTERFTTTFGPKITPAETNDDANNTNLFEGIYLLISVLSTMRPIVLIIDDLQWADEASLRLFHYLSRHVVSNSVLLIGTSRTDRYDLQKDGKPAMIVDVLARIWREGNCEQITLSRLSRESCSLLIDKSLSPALFTEEFYDNIFVETNGNPLFVLETLKLMRESGGIFFKNGAWQNKQNDLEISVPNRVEDILIRRISGLTDEERETLQIAAVQGYKFDASLLSQILEISKIKLLKILQRVERELQIITSTDQGFQFEHPMLRDLLYNEIPAALCKEYHLMIASELERLHSPDFGALVGDIARHHRRGGNHIKAVPLLYQAGVRAFNLSAYREASLFFEDFLDSIECSGQSMPENVSRVELYFKLGICYEECGQWELGLDAYAKLLECSKKSSQPTRQIDALLRTGRIYGKLGNLNSALESYEHCLRIVEQQPIPNVLSRIYNNIGIIKFYKGDYDQATRYFEQTLKAVDCDMGDRDKAHALTNLGIIANMHGDYDTALQSYQEAVAIYESRGNRQGLARIHHNIGMTHADRGEWAESIKAFKRCLKLIDEVEDKQLRSLTYLNMGKTYVRQKNLNKAKEFTEKAFKFFKRTDDTLNVAEAYHILGHIYGTKGDFSASEKFLKESISLHEQIENMEGLAETYTTYGNICHDQGNIDRAKEYHEKALEIFKKLKLHGKIKELLKTIDDPTLNTTTEVKVVDIDVEQKLSKKYASSVQHS